MRYLMQFTGPAEMSRILLKEHGVEMSEGRLVELAESNHMPCYRVDGKPMFRPEVVKQYIADHFVEENDCRPFPTRLAVFDPTLAPYAANPLPTALAPMSGSILELSPYFMQPVTCVYFLVQDEEVVYVGQSTNLMGRLQAHDRTRFDRVLFLCVPGCDLCHVELEFIRALRPRFNRTGIPRTYPREAL